jgi:hypothetical protein
VIRALTTLVAGAGQWLAHARRPVMALAVAAALAGCDGGSGSGQRGSAFTFLTVDFSNRGTVGAVNSSINVATATLACATLQNNLKNPTITTPTSLDNVIIQSYTVTLIATGGGSLPGPFTFGTSVLVPAGTVSNGAVTAGGVTFPVVLVPAGAKLDPRLRPPTRLPLVATAEVTFRGRDGRGTSVETEGAATVVFEAGSAEGTTTCGTTTTPPTTPAG